MSNRRANILIVLLLMAITIAVYWPVLGHRFNRYDDDLYVTQNPMVSRGLSWEGVLWAFRESHAANWHPLTWISHMVDSQIYGLRPAGHHATNLLLHIANTLLLFYVLTRMTGHRWRSAFVAALFAIHPLHVESVAWVAERKDVLSTLFWLLTMLAYLRYVERPSTARYVLVTTVFALGLMAKPMLVSLPVVLLLLDYWPLNRFASVRKKKGKNTWPGWRLVWEKIPLGVLSLASCGATVAAQRSGYAVLSVDRLPLGVRIANAFVSYIAYLVKTFFPKGLAAIYPHPTDGLPEWQVVGSAVLMLAISLAAVRFARKKPYVATGWFWYVITLIPVIGLVQVGPQAMADRYTYVTLIGPFVALTWLAGEMLQKRTEDPKREATESDNRTFARPTAAVMLAVVIIVALMPITYRQVGYWRDTETLFKRALEVTKNNYVAEVNYGIALQEKGKVDEAIRHYERAMKIGPEGFMARLAMANALLQKKELDEALVWYSRILESEQLTPYRADVHYNVGSILAAKGKYEEAREHYTKAIEINPRMVEAYYHLALLARRQGDHETAIKHFTAMLRINPRLSYIQREIADSYARMGDHEKAANEYRIAIRMNPRDAVAHNNLGLELIKLGKAEEAIKELRQAVRLKPDYAWAHQNLGAMLDSMGDTDAAISEYRKALKLNPTLAEAHNNLAVALYFKKDYAGAWAEVRLARKYGVQVNPGFLDALRAKMPEPK